MWLCESVALPKCKWVWERKRNTECDRHVCVGVSERENVCSWCGVCCNPEAIVMPAVFSCDLLSFWHMPSNDRSNMSRNGLVASLKGAADEERKKLFKTFLIEIRNLLPSCCCCCCRRRRCCCCCRRYVFDGTRWKTGRNRNNVRKQMERFNKHM